MRLVPGQICYGSEIVQNCGLAPDDKRDSIYLWDLIPYTVIQKIEEK